MVKKRKLPCKEGRRRRRQAMQRKRRESGRSPDRAQVSFTLETEGVDPELLADIRNIAGESRLVDPEVLRQMARISDQLADEPEMRGVMAEPGLALAALISQLDADDLRRGEDINLGDDTLHEALDAGPDGEWFPFLNLVYGDLENALEDPQDPLAFGFVRSALLAETMPYYAETVHEEEE